MYSKNRIVLKSPFRNEDYYINCELIAFITFLVLGELTNIEDFENDLHISIVMTYLRADAIAYKTFVLSHFENRLLLAPSPGRLYQHRILCGKIKPGKIPLV